MVAFQIAYTSVFGAFAVFVHLRTGKPPFLDLIDPTVYDINRDPHGLVTIVLGSLGV